MFFVEYYSIYGVGKDFLRSLFSLNCGFYWNLQVALTYIIISTSTSVLLLFIQKLSLLISDDKGFISQDIRKEIHNAIGNKVFKFILTMIVFLFFYTGLINFLIIIGILITYIILLIMFDAIFHSENIQIENDFWLEFKNSETILHKINLVFEIIDISHNGFFSNFDFKKTFQFIQKGQYLQFILSKIGIMLILFSLALGVGRANYVQNHILVNVNKDKQTYVLYLATGDGIALYNASLKQVSFISWGNVKNLLFLSKERRSLTDIFDKSSKEK